MPFGSSPRGDGVATSRFTYRHLAQLASYVTTCPLRVIAHVDLDAFYAQCEMVRLQVDEEQPLVVQQWKNLIAVNYPARKFGISRGTTAEEAKKLCPNLIAQHVATWRAGDDRWAYRNDAASHIDVDKVSLDPYRLESRKIFAVVRESLPPDLQRIEKAGIDEMFLDLSAHVHAILVSRFPELEGHRIRNGSTDFLPLPSVAALDWHEDMLVALGEDDEVVDPDWDDVAMCIAAEIVRDVRGRVRDRLQYTCSAGIARNKMLSKLGSAYRKPNQQSVIRNRAIPHFLADTKFTKIRMLGGKLGRHVADVFDAKSTSDIVALGLDQLKSRLGDETGAWLHDVVRGVDVSEVNPRTKIQSMLSAKSFQPHANDIDAATKWLRIFAADIYARLADSDDLLGRRRRPRTLTLHYRTLSRSHSRQSPIPPSGPLSEKILFDLAFDLLHQVDSEGGLWPCAHLSVGVGSFQDGPVGTMAIRNFLIKAPDPKSTPAPPSVPEPIAEVQGPSTLAAPTSVTATATPVPGRRKRPADETAGIQRFLTRGIQPAARDNGPTARPVSGELWGEGAAPPIASSLEPRHCPSSCTSPSHFGQMGPPPEQPYQCTRCDDAQIESFDALQCHMDWHFARDLQDREQVQGRGRAPDRDQDRAKNGGRGISVFAAPSEQVASSPTFTAISGARSGTVPKRAARKSRLEPGQSTLNFG